MLAEAGKKMQIAYLPDSFGHPAQMPQIVDGLGMHTAVFWRGVPKRVEQTEFCWASPYKYAKTFCLHMPFGYGNSANLSEDLSVTLPRVRQMIDSLSVMTPTGMVLLMNGSDHIVAQNNITSLVNQLNARLEDTQIELTTLEDYLEKLRKKTGELPVYCGELRSGERSMLLGGTLSSRMYLKQKNETVQNKLERYLEPVLAFETLLGGNADERPYLRYLWKKVLENHPHDSICGCSIDSVHQEMMTRFASVEQLEDTLLENVISRNTLAGITPGTRQTELLIFDPVPVKRQNYTELDVYMDRTLVQEVNFAKSTISDYEPQITHPAMPSGLRVTDETGAQLPYVILEQKKEYETYCQDHTSPEIYKTNKLRLGILLPAWDFGFHRLTVTPSEKAGAPLVRTDDRQIENEYYRIFEENGSLTVQEKKTGVYHRGFAKFVDKGDVGDEYTYSWPEHDTLAGAWDPGVCVERKMLGQIGQSLCLTGTVSLPAAASADRKSRSKDTLRCPFRMEVRLYCGVDRIDCRLEFENRAKDHLFQVEIPSGVRTDICSAYDAFHITQRPVQTAVPETWAEYPQSTHPTHGYIELRNGEDGVAVGTRGLTEYEAVQNQEETAVRVTLLRCVGWLSRMDLLTRAGNGGWTFETPEAQCLGTHCFEFCAVYRKTTTESFGSIEKFRLPSYAQRIQTGNRLAALTEPLLRSHIYSCS